MLFKKLSSLGSGQFLKLCLKSQPLAGSATCNRAFHGSSDVWEPENKIVADRFRTLPQAKDNIFLTYIWIDGTGIGLRSKTLVAKKEPGSIKDVPHGHFDGSSTYQASGEESDMSLRPVAMCPDPFFVGKSKLVMCEVYDAKGNPSVTNHRAKLIEALGQCGDQDPWFGMEQEFTLLGTNGRPCGFPSIGYPEPQGPYYCAVGVGNQAGRDVLDSHLMACKYAGLEIGGTNAEVLLGQWEYQIGPSKGADLGDEMWLSRFILERVGEEFGVKITLDPKPVPGDWNGTGNHCNFSTTAMRQEGGLKEIWSAIKKLEKRHKEHIVFYDPHGGEDNKRRLTGLHETASIDEFSAAEGSRTVSVRVPAHVAKAGKGWLEDRRPAANADPYAVTNMMVRTCCLDE